MLQPGHFPLKKDLLGRPEAPPIPSSIMPGVVQIPPQPQVGRNAIHIELEGAELAETLRLLSLAVKAYENQREPASAPQASHPLRGTWAMRTSLWKW